MVISPSGPHPLMFVRKLTTDGSTVNDTVTSQYNCNVPDTSNTFDVSKIEVFLYEISKIVQSVNG